MNPMAELVVGAIAVGVAVLAPETGGGGIGVEWIQAGAAGVALTMAWMFIRDRERESKLAAEERTRDRSVVVDVTNKFAETQRTTVDKFSETVRFVMDDARDRAAKAADETRERDDKLHALLREMTENKS